MTKFMRPEVTVESVGENVSRYIVEPLDRGFGYTLGNCMRRVLLSSLEGAAATSIRIDGAQHEFTALDGMREDVTDIILNVKSLVFRDTGIGEESAEAELSVTGPAVVTGADLKVPNEFELVNPDQEIANLNDGASLTMYVNIDTGRGYVSAERNKRAGDAIGVIPVDSLFSPVQRCTYTVENTRVGQRTDYERLIIEVETNGSVAPDDVIARAGRVINEHTQLFVEQTIAPIEEGSIFVEIDRSDTSGLDTPIEELDLSVRAYNCLKRQGVNTIGQLTECTENDLMNVRNFGAKSIEEVKDKLIDMGLNLKI
ncbi:MAG: DNA-directed RNA polymerase subunit alpha [Coriobacteriia bacterium]|nr:DNA-directed RNA polymerase subunit alpha [Coriobacteriia bacterium]MCL2745881.1 DNA-directed RNA polymerase subunit alpha [Coriobacteriia bacterium]MCL2870323.1 DNA-directed RNA polymerase subunit alpha [Coriobacteriia bacterium]